MDNLHYRLTFDLDNKNEIPGKNLLKVVKFKIWLKNVVMCGKYSLTMFANFLIIVLRAAIVTIFEPKGVAIFIRNTIMRKFANFVRLYIFQTLQHVSTKFWNLTTFEEFLPGISFFSSRFV